VSNSSDYSPVSGSGTVVDHPRTLDKESIRNVGTYFHSQHEAQQLRGACERQAMVAFSRTSWRALHDRGSHRLVLGAITVDETYLFGRINAALSELDASVADCMRRGEPREPSMQAGRTEFATRSLQLCTDALASRDRRLLQVIAAGGVDALVAAQRLGVIEPPWLQLGHKDTEREATSQLANALDRSRATRAHALAQRLARDVSVARGRGAQGTRPPRSLAHPSAQLLLSASDVGRLRAGSFVVIDPPPAMWLSQADLALAETELRTLNRSFGTASASSCNRGAITSSVPLLGEGYNLSPATLRLLRLLAAIPAVIEEHGWPRPLALPPLLQLASYSAKCGAHYTRHYDWNAWEKANRREITILLYLNTGWDAVRCGGALRLFPTAAADAASGSEAPPTDVAPMAGRLVLFPSATQAHAVLPCIANSERLALTLWVEHADAG
jgi:hypothetical protein